MPERDPLLHRIERDAAIVCLVLAGAALALGGWRALLGVLAGGLVIIVSYRGIKSGIDGVIGRESSRGWALVKFVTRYAILGFAAYVMMVRLRAHPVWMLAGASSLVAAVAVEAVRQTRSRP